MADSLGLITVQSNGDIEREEQERREAARAAKEQDPVVTELGAYVRRCWNAAKDAKVSVQDRMLQCLRQRLGEYTDSKLSEIRDQGGSEIYMMLTDEKCTAAEAWIEDILFPADDKPWSIEPTPIPEMPENHAERVKEMVRQQVGQHYMQTGMMPSAGEIRQAAAQIKQQMTEHVRSFAAEQDGIMETKIEDDLLQAEWYPALKEAIQNIVTYPCGFMKGPVPRKKRELIWGQGPDGEPVAVVEEKIVFEFEAPSPFDVYPAPASRDIGDGYLIEVHHLTAGSLYDLIGVDGYDEDAIRAVLDMAKTGGGMSGWLDEASSKDARDKLQNREDEDEDPEGRIPALQFWGEIKGSMLVEWGMDESEVEDQDALHPAEVWLIGDHVIKVELSGDPLGRIPYFKAAFRQLPGSFWGQSLPEVISDIQDVCNATARNLVNNMGFSSGPQVAIDAGSMDPDEDVTEIFPWKIWQFDMSRSMTGRAPIWFFQPDMNAGELLRVYEHFSLEADNKSGVPKYSYGSGKSTGALGTATGFSLMQANAARGIKRVVRNIDGGVIEQSVQRMVEWNLLYGDGAYRGDIKIIAKGSSALVAKEQQQVRRTEALQVILNPAVLQIIGQPGLAEYLRDYFSGLDVDADKIVPAREAIQQQVQQQQMMQQMMMQAQGQVGTPAGQSPPAKVPETDTAGQLVSGQDMRLAGR